jgi:sulfur transfer protein SufE
VDGGPQLRFQGDCDTAIIKGVVALLVELFSGKTAEEIEATTWTPVHRDCSSKSTSARTATSASTPSSTR